MTRPCALEEVLDILYNKKKCKFKFFIQRSDCMSQLPLKPNCDTQESEF